MRCFYCRQRLDVLSYVPVYREFNGEKKLVFEAVMTEEAKKDGHKVLVCFPRTDECVSKEEKKNESVDEKH